MFYKLYDQAIVKITGKDRYKFMHGITSYNFLKAKPNDNTFTVMLNPQGKYLFEFFINIFEDEILLQINKEKVSTLIKKLNMYKLRSDVQISTLSDQYAILSSTSIDEELTIKHYLRSHRDFRHPALGYRYIIDKILDVNININESLKDYHLHRISLGIVDGNYELIPNKSIVLEAGYDNYNAIDYSKGCYMGQELMSRIKHRNLLTKKMAFVKLNSDPFATQNNTNENDNIVIVNEQKARMGRLYKPNYLGLHDNDIPHNIFIANLKLEAYNTKLFLTKSSIEIKPLVV